MKLNRNIQPDWPKTKVNGENVTKATIMKRVMIRFVMNGKARHVTDPEVSSDPYLFHVISLYCVFSVVHLFPYCKYYHPSVLMCQYYI